MRYFTLRDVCGLKHKRTAEISPRPSSIVKKFVFYLIRTGGQACESKIKLEVLLGNSRRLTGGSFFWRGTGVRERLRNLNTSTKAKINQGASKRPKGQRLRILRVII